ncbi:MAG: CBS domain-containing protein [Polyangiaceae bacterium]|nr:CBS domain-containing protein [Polyangiaceae bacterium]
MTALWSKPVRDYMSKGLVAVHPTMPLAELQQVLEDRNISAVPVVDDGARLLGIVSTTDLLRVAHVEISYRGARPRVAMPASTARDVMRPEVATVDEAAPLSAAAQTMVERRIHRLIVLHEGRAAAVVSTRDAMRAVLEHHVALPLSVVMSHPVETIELGETIRSAVDRLRGANVRGLVVVDGTWPIGVFTHSEAIRARALPQGLLDMPVEDLMSYEMYCLDVETPLYRVAGHAIQTGVRRILAVRDRRVHGIVTGFDLVRVMTMAEA